MKKPEEYATTLPADWVYDFDSICALISRVQRDAVAHCSDFFLESVHDKWTSSEAADAIRALLEAT